MLKKIVLFGSLTLLFLISCKKTDIKKIAIIPFPQEVVIKSGTLDLSKGFTIQIESPELKPLKEIISDDYFLLFKKELQKNNTKFYLNIDKNLKEDAYTLEVANSITIKGGSYAAVALGLNSIWQMVDANFEVPKIAISDYPNYNYRSIMLDLARAWHTPEKIKEIIDLCRWYKINYLHLHLTDDSAFTFPSESFPRLATKGHSYTKEQLVELNEYAYNRGVVLIPEIDVPGHSSQFLKKMPELFGIKEVSKNPYTITMGSEETYEALEKLFEEVAAIFTYSPFIHIGGDEAFFEGMQDDPKIVAYMEKHKLPNMHELFLHFLTRVNTIVKKTGKQTILWGGFGEKGNIQLPKDMIVMIWEHTHQDPHNLLEKKYPIINASFKPLYVVNNRKWEPEYIYNQWNPNRWESWTNKGDFHGEELQENKQILGATLCAWEQSQINQMPRLRNRIATVAQHLWSVPKLPWNDFEIQQKSIDQKLNDLTIPFNIEIKGLTYPHLKEGNFYEHLWFGNKLSITAKANIPNTELQYATQNNPKPEDWKTFKDSISFVKNSAFHLKAKTKEGKQIGRTYYQNFYYKPLKVSTTGLEKEMPIGSWDKLRFKDTLWVHFSSELQNNTIRYETSGKRVSKDSPIYKGAFSITKTSRVYGQLFDNKNKPMGSQFGETYYKIWEEKSLTTNKPITASNDHIRPNCAEPANNGRVTLWEMWGDHVSEENWVQIDLEKVEEISRFKIYTFWDNWRYYQYIIEGSLDGKDWSLLVDFSKNTQKATEKGIEHIIEKTKARYVRINMLYNSANPGLHLVEFSAFKK